MSLSKLAPTGVGVWIWQPKHCDGGDQARIVARLRAAGVRWVLLKVGDTERGWPAQGLLHGWEQFAHACRAAGIGVYAWAYVSTFDPAAEARMVLDALATRAFDGFMFDPEGEEEQTSGHGALVREMLGRVREKEPDAWLGFAPFPYPSVHPQYPWREFMGVCDAVHPQAYWPGLQVPPEWACERAEIEFADLRTRWPETAHCALSVAGVMHGCPPDELRRFLVDPLATAAPSLWTYEYASPQHWAALESFARGEPAPARPPVATVSDLQTALARLGFACGTPDGRWGPKTAAAVSAFQRSRHLAVGPVGPLTLAAVGSS